MLHLLRGASQEVTLLLCRPPPGVLPEMDQGWQVRYSALDLAICLMYPFSYLVGPEKTTFALGRVQCHFLSLGQENS